MEKATASAVTLLASLKHHPVYTVGVWGRVDAPYLVVYANSELPDDVVPDRYDGLRVEVRPTSEIV